MYQSILHACNHTASWICKLHDGNWPLLPCYSSNSIAMLWLYLSQMHRIDCCGAANCCDAMRHILLQCYYCTYLRCVELIVVVLRTAGCIKGGRVVPVWMCMRGFYMYVLHNIRAAHTCLCCIIYVLHASYKCAYVPLVLSRLKLAAMRWLVWPFL